MPFPERMGLAWGSVLSSRVKARDSVRTVQGWDSVLCVSVQAVHFKHPCHFPTPKDSYVLMLYELPVPPGCRGNDGGVISSFPTASLIE